MSSKVKARGVAWPLVAALLVLPVAAGCTVDNTGVGSLGQATRGGTRVDGTLVSISDGENGQSGVVRLHSMERLNGQGPTLDSVDGTVTLLLGSGDLEAGHRYVLYVGLPQVAPVLPSVDFALDHPTGAAAPGFTDRGDNGSTVEELMECMRDELALADPTDAPTALASEGTGEDGPAYRALYGCATS